MFTNVNDSNGLPRDIERERVYVWDRERESERENDAFSVVLIYANKTQCSDDSYNISDHCNKMSLLLHSVNRFGEISPLWLSLGRIWGGGIYYVAIFWN